MNPLATLNPLVNLFIRSRPWWLQLSILLASTATATKFWTYTFQDDLPITIELSFTVTQEEERRI